MQAAAVGLGAIDGPDEGEGVTAAELRQHLRALLQVRIRPAWQP